ncbi:MAG: TonB-dependent receptor [Acidobacteriota bacterium]
MKQIAKWPLVAIALLLCGNATAAVVPLGTISGTVKDADGRPVVGAMVSLFDTTQSDELLKLIKTDKRGRFIAANLFPGRYTLRASAEGYKAELITAAAVTPNQTAVFNFTLRRASELIDDKDETEKLKYTLRRNRHIFQLDKEESIIAVAEKKPILSETHGLVSFSATQALSERPGAGSFASVNFALAQMFNNNLELVVAGQTGLGHLSPQRLETQASVQAGDNHQLTLSVGYGHIPTFNPDPDNRRVNALNQYSLRATDHWHITGPVVVLYGFDYSRFDGGSQVSQLNPHFNLELQLSANDRLFAAIYSPNGADIESSEEFETTRVDFRGPVELIDLNSQAPVDRSRRYEVGYAHTFKDRSQLETTLFWDHIAGRTMGLMVPPDAVNADETANLENEPATPTPFTIEQRGRARGVRILLTRPITNTISASLGYSFGQGQQFNLTPEGQPVVSLGYFQVVSGKFDAKIVRTGTHISAVVRLATPPAIFAIDPFQRQPSALDPSISVYLTQSLPMFSFIPGHWEANVAARNLLDNGNGDQQPQLVIGQYWRTIRGGLSVRF